VPITRFVRFFSIFSNSSKLTTWSSIGINKHAHYGGLLIPQLVHSVRSISYVLLKLHRLYIWTIRWNVRSTVWSCS